MNYIGITFSKLTKEQIEILIALLPEMGFHGMEETEAGISAFADEGKADFEALSDLCATQNITFTQEKIEAKNWNETWESNFDPVLIPGKIQVRAHFHALDTAVKHQILITPKMSFGTGHHPTTRMMMMAMLEIDFVGRTVVDFGTGTGILAILAEQLGASQVLAIDNDDWSIENVLENISLNNAKSIAVFKADNLDAIEQADIMMANINKHILIEHVSALRAKTKPNGILVISGLLRTDYEAILAVFCPFFGQNHTRLEEGEWLAMVFKP
jgi:ribosomal protein L11 methyltransferase